MCRCSVTFNGKILAQSHSVWLLEEADGGAQSSDVCTVGAEMYMVKTSKRRPNDLGNLQRHASHCFQTWAKGNGS
jgi:hypothetical protein